MLFAGKSVYVPLGPTSVSGKDEAAAAVRGSASSPSLLWLLLVLVLMMRRCLHMCACGVFMVSPCCNISGVDFATNCILACEHEMRNRNGRGQENIAQTSMGRGVGSDTVPQHDGGGRGNGGTDGAPSLGRRLVAE